VQPSAPCPFRVTVSNTTSWNGALSRPTRARAGAAELFPATFSKVTFFVWGSRPGLCGAMVDPV
jgi:hypothetical protein